MTVDIGNVNPTVSKITPSEIINKERAVAQKVKANSELHQKTITKLQQVTEASQKKRTEIREILKELMNTTEFYNKKLDFEFKEALDQVVVKVIDKGSGEVLKQYPPEEMQKLHLRIREAVGLLFDEKI
ncbi:flagellar protein FlaG [Spirochaeta cellobiosiphila]|uniref:flagellar protein FlaG n=1 Tax=Spirochaeta cellobiosiphila TaxID=504483 RepID=UPI0004006DFD|nr:flagellar protein FlaG [Spirochaeta cellobiosiphila]